jgi:hypothetical protein
MKSVFQKRIRSAFPTGISESELIRNLQGQGFTDPLPFKDKRYVKFSEGSFPCLLTWTITWQAGEQGGASEINGDLRRSCL